MTTIRDVATRAQVSVGTVSRVLNDHPSVRPRARRAVLDAIDELQYWPNSIARTLRTSKTHTLGFVVSDLLTNYALSGAEFAAQEHGYALLVVDSQFNLGIEARNIRSLVERRVDGLLCNPVESSRIIYDLVRGSGVPTVVWGWTVPNRVLPTAVISEIDAIGEAVDHLAQLRHRRLATIVSRGPKGAAGGIRQRLIQDALRQRGLDPASNHIVEVASPAECSEAVHDLLTCRTRPTALIVASHRLAPASLIGIREAGLKIPYDISYISFGDSEWERAVDPPINVISIDGAAHGEAATRLLIDLVEQRPDLPRIIQHQAQYICRGSVERIPGRRSRSAERSGPATKLSMPVTSRSA